LQHSDTRAGDDRRYPCRAPRSTKIPERTIAALGRGDGGYDCGADGGAQCRSRCLGNRYGLVNAVSDETARFYFAFVNYTTLGYGDVVPVKEWQLLGPITAMNGILLFGWSTAVIFEVLQRALLLEDAVKARPSVAAE
jgi:hypothetical protein